MLYKDLRSDIIINGSFIEGFKILKGVKQGDALSVILFIMCIEPLIRNINENRNIETLASQHLPIRLPKTLGFADDVTVVTKRSNECIQEVFKVYEEFTEASGLMLNADKTEIMCFNQARDTNQQFVVDYCNRQYVINCVERLKINGILFLQDKRRHEEANVAKVIDSMDRLLRPWSTRNLTLIGKILIIKTFAVSQAIYLMQSMTLDLASHKAIEKLIYKFLWNKNFNAAKAPDRLKRKIMETETKFGGFGMVNVKLLNDSLDLRSFSRLLVSNHPFFEQIKDLVDSKDFFNVQINACVDRKLTNSIKLLNENRRKVLDLTTDELLANSNYISLLNNFKVVTLMNAVGRRSVPFFLIHRRSPDICVTDLAIREFDSVARYSKYPQLAEGFKSLIRNRLRAQGTAPINELYFNRDRAVVSICTLSSKDLRMNQINVEDRMICTYKSGLILDPGELTSWTLRTRKLTSTRHKNVILRVAHGDVFSNGRLHRFSLKDNPGCSNCAEPNESPLHRIVNCPNAVRTWELLNEIKGRVGLNQLSDSTIENILGAKDRLSKIELALQAEVLLRIISSSERYIPDVIVKASVRLIYHSEKLNPELKEKLKDIIE